MRSGRGSVTAVTDSYSHLGVCVSDLDRSLRFYTEGLGFEEAESWARPEDGEQVVSYNEVCACDM